LWFDLDNGDTITKLSPKARVEEGLDRSDNVRYWIAKLPLISHPHRSFGDLRWSRKRRDAYWATPQHVITSAFNIKVWATKTYINSHEKPDYLTSNI